MCVSFLISSKFPVRLNLDFFLVNACTPHIVPLLSNPTGTSTNSYVALWLLYAIHHKPSLTPIFFHDCCMQYTYSALWLLYAIHHKPSLTHIFLWLLYTMHLYYSVTAVYAIHHKPTYVISVSYCITTHYNIILQQLYYRTHLTFRSPSVSKTPRNLL